MTEIMRSLIDALLTGDHKRSQALAKASEELDSEAALAIVERIRAEHPDEADIIANLIDGYRFDRISELCALS